MTEKTPKPVPGFLEPADDSERKILAKMKQDKKLLLSKDEQEAVEIMRRALNGMRAEEAVESILNMFSNTKNNNELIEMVKKKKIL